MKYRFADVVRVWMAMPLMLLALGLTYLPRVPCWRIAKWLCVRASWLAGKEYCTALASQSDVDDGPYR